MPRNELTEQQRTMDRIVQTIRKTRFQSGSLVGGLPKTGFDLSLEDLAEYLERQQAYMEGFGKRYLAEQEELAKWHDLAHSLAELFAAAKDGPKPKKKSSSIHSLLLPALTFLTTEVQERLAAAHEQRQRERESLEES